MVHNYKNVSLTNNMKNIARTYVTKYNGPKIGCDLTMPGKSKSPKIILNNVKTEFTISLKSPI